jgi:predicted transcriptional regulator
MRKFTVEFGPEGSRVIARIAKARKYSRVDVVQHALNVYAFLEEKARNGVEIYTETSDGEKRRFVLSD